MPRASVETLITQMCGSSRLCNEGRGLRPLLSSEVNVGTASMQDRAMLSTLQGEQRLGRVCLPLGSLQFGSNRIGISRGSPTCCSLHWDLQ